jgi:tetratricopeptide (TPR) repeat protein
MRTNGARTISAPIRRTALSTVVEDHTGTADLISIYNVNVDLDDDVFLPWGSYLAIRAPYYKLSANGNYTIRTDHPSDVVKVDATHPLVTQFRWKDQRGTIVEEDDPLLLKEEGNVLYRRGDHHAAIAKYTTSLESPALTKGSELWRNLRHNRALTRLRVFQFDGTIRDCDEIILSFPKDPKALFLKGRALYHLRRYEEAHASFQCFLDVDGDSDEGKQHLLLASKRMDESVSGNFNFKEMRGMTEIQEYPRLDYGNYVGPVKVRQCNSTNKGRGVFATRDIDQGELIICEKAFAIAYEGEIGRCATVNTVKNKLYLGPDSYLPPKIVQLLFDNPSMADQYLNLYSGGRDRPGRSISFTDEGTPIIDAFTVAAILDYNAFKTENIVDLLDVTTDAEDEPEDDGGIWIQTSYLNHSCTGNVFRTFIGDFAIIRALRPIKNGEELHHSYVPVLNSLEKRQEALSKYGFTCSCEVCKIQRGVSQRELRLRDRAYQDFQMFDRRVWAQPVTPALVNRARSLSKAIRKTYSTPKFCEALMMPYALSSSLLYAAGKKMECIADLTEVITLVSGADASKMEKFEPLVWTPELMLLLLSLCVVLQDVGSKQKASRCKEACRRMYGIVSGLGYEAVSIGDVIGKHKRGMKGT